MVVYDALERGGLYIRAEEGHPLDGDGLDEALAIHNAFRIAQGKSALERVYYIGNSPQRMWSAKIINLWVNGTERDASGLLIKDYRQKITAKDLL